MSVGEADITVIVPTLNEAENLPVLVPRIVAAVGQRPVEILIVDDGSRDATGQVCAELAREYPLRLLVREEPKDGLSGAVLHGMAQGRGGIFVVMDADLQHPPERIGALLEPLESGEADFVIGSRYIPGAGMAEQWGWARRVNSKVATWLARPFAGRISDPMSGFFALRRQTYEGAQRLTPLGYKIALELMCKCRVRQVREIPIHFGLRHKGESKLTLKQQFRYLEHLSRLYDFTFPRASPVGKFLIATACGWFVALAAYLGLLGQMTLAPAAALAYPFDILITAAFHLRYVRTQREFIVRPHPWRDFWAIALAEWLACVLVAWWVAARVQTPTAGEVFLLAFGAATVVRYAMRKELMQDIRGLRRELRREELAVPPSGESRVEAPAAVEGTAARTAGALPVPRPVAPGPGAGTGSGI